MNVELIGIVATLFVLLSFVYSGERKIRMTNIIGAVLFVVYGLLINAVSVWILNTALIAIHFYKLTKRR